MKRKSSRLAQVAGIGESEIVGDVPGRSSLTLQAEAAMSALVDAGVDPEAVDWLLTSACRADGFDRQAVALAQYLGIRPSAATTIKTSGSTGLSAVASGVAAVQSGVARNALVVVGDSLRSGVGRSTAADRLAQGRDAEWELPYGPLVASMFALAYDMRLGERLADPEELASVPVAMRRHASRNPRAQKQEALSVDDVLASPMVSTPFRKLDCSLVSDGAAAVLLVPADQQLARQSVALVGMGGSVQHENLMVSRDPASGLADAAVAAYEMADIDVHDADFFGIYDCFSGSVFMEMEALGMCSFEDAPMLVKEGQLDLAGQFPSNTHGGLLSYCHMGSGAGLFHFLEAVRQHRGEAGERQLDKCDVSVINNIGGVFAVNTVAVLRSY